jgi:O-antigen ligase
MNSTMARNSTAVRLLTALGVFVYDNWQKGIFCRFLVFLKDNYVGSVSERLWLRFCGAPDPTPCSRYAAFMGRIRSMLWSLGDILRKSLFYRFVCGVRNLYFRITKGSILFTQVNRLSLHQWFLVAFAFYLPLEYAIRDILEISILSSIWEELFILCAAVLILWRTSLRQTEAIARETPVDAWMILFMAVGLFLMSVVAPYPAVALLGYRAVVEYMVWFLLIVRLIENDKDMKVLYYSFVIMATGLALHGIYQYIIAVPIPAEWVSQTEMGVRTRVFSLTGSPNIFGSLLVMLAPLAAGLIYYSEKVWQKFLFFCVTGMMCLCLLFTFSRGAWVGMVVTVVIFALYIDRRLFVVMGAAAASALILVPSITSRLTYLFTSDYAEASAVGGRALRWETGKLLLHENNPWLGFGLGRFGGAVAMNNKLLDETPDFSYFYMDNYYLKTMVEMGYIGIIFFMLLLAALMIWGLRAIYRSGLEYKADNEGLVSSRIKNDPLKRAVGNPKILAIGIFSGLCGVLVHCYFENIFEEPYMMAYFWGLAGLLMYLGFFRTAHLRPNK